MTYNSVNGNAECGGFLVGDVVRSANLHVTFGCDDVAKGSMVQLSLVSAKEREFSPKHRLICMRA